MSEKISWGGGGGENSVFYGVCNEMKMVSRPNSGV